MTDKTQPEAGSTHIIRYALELGLLWIDGSGRDQVREALDALDALEDQLEAVGAGGVQALSAAPKTAPQPAPAPLSDDVVQKTWALIDELEKLRGADRYDEDWDTLNKRDSELRAALTHKEKP